MRRHTHLRAMLSNFEEADCKLNTSFCRPRLPFFKVKGKDRKIWRRIWCEESKCWNMRSNRKGMLLFDEYVMKKCWRQKIYFTFVFEKTQEIFFLSLLSSQIDRFYCTKKIHLSNVFVMIRTVAKIVWLLILLKF